MGQQLRDWLDLSLNHSMPSSLLILSRFDPANAIRATLYSLPDEVVDIVGVMSLPSEDFVSERRRKLDFLQMQEELIKMQLAKLDKIHLVPGAHLDVMLLGGPEKWNNGVDFVETMEILIEQLGHIDNGAYVERLSESYKSLYRVSCQMLGTYKIVFKRGNLVRDGHPLPAVAEVTLSLICSIPASIVLMADEHVNEHEVIRTAIQADRSSGQIVSPLLLWQLGAPLD